MLEAFREGGWGMFPTALFGVLSLAVAIRYATRPSNRWIPLQIALAILTLATGALGFVTGLIASATHVGGVEPGRVVQLFAVGFGESLHNVSLALATLSLAAMLVSVGAVRQLRVVD